MNKNPNRYDNILGNAIILGMGSGFASFVFAIISFLNGQWIATAICLVAASLAFGLMSIALLNS